jgi:plastocyanin
MKVRTIGIFDVLMGVTLTFSILMALNPGPPLEIYATTEDQEEKSEEAEITNMTNVTGPGGTLPSLSTPGEKTFYVFTSEVEGVEEEKLKIAGDSFDVKTLVANKGDEVAVKFYNVDEVQSERHSFTIGDPFKVDIDLGFAENGNATFIADQSGVFPYYCRYHLPVMAGQLIVLP